VTENPGPVGFKVSLKSELRKRLTVKLNCDEAVSVGVKLLQKKQRRCAVKHNASMFLEYYWRLPLPPVS